MADEERSAIYTFRGMHPLETAIARYYWNRGWDVQNIQAPSYIPEYPIIGQANRIDPMTGKHLWRPFGYVGCGIPGCEAMIASRKKTIEMFLEKADLWVVDPVDPDNLVYKCHIHHYDRALGWREDKEEITLHAKGA